MRNARIYSEADPDIAKAIENIKQQIVLTSKLLNLQRCNKSDDILTTSGLLHDLQRKPMPQFVLVKWQPHEPGMFKINCDGSSHGNTGAAGGGFVLRNTDGRVIEAGFKYFEIGTNMAAEIYALTEGVKLCQNHHISRIWFEVDSQIMVTMVKGLTPIPWKFLMDIHNIQYHLAYLDYTITHIRREGNYIADFLSKLASITHGHQNYLPDDLPEDLRRLVRWDELQVHAIRIK